MTQKTSSLNLYPNVEHQLTVLRKIFTFLRMHLGSFMCTRIFLCNDVPFNDSSESYPVFGYDAWTEACKGARAIVYIHPEVNNRFPVQIIVVLWFDDNTLVSASFVVLWGANLVFRKIIAVQNWQIPFSANHHVIHCCGVRGFLRELPRICGNELVFYALVKLIFGNVGT